MLYRDTLESISCPHLRGADRCADPVAVEVRPSSAAMGPILAEPATQAATDKRSGKPDDRYRTAIRSWLSFSPAKNLRTE